MTGDVKCLINVITLRMERKEIGRKLMGKFGWGRDLLFFRFFCSFALPSLNILWFWFSAFIMRGILESRAKKECLNFLIYFLIQLNKYLLANSGAKKTGRQRASFGDTLIRRNWAEHYFLSVGERGFGRMYGFYHLH